MAAGSFQVGQRFSLEDRRYRLSRSLEDDTWQFEEIASGRIFEKKQAELLTLWGQGKLAFASEARSFVQATKVETSALNSAFEDAYRQSYSEESWKQAQGRLAFVSRLESVPMTKAIVQPIVRDIWEDKSIWKDGAIFHRAPCFATVAVWVRDYRLSGGDIRSLVCRDHAKGSRESLLGSIVEEIADDAIETIYMTPERQTIQEVREHARGLIAKRNLGRLASEKIPTPSFAYFKRKIGQIAPYDKWRARYGQRIADIKFRAAGQGVPECKPLARACMDHCRLDVVVLDDESGLPLGRPWLTLILDEATRYVLGYYIGFEEPSNVSVARALRHAFMPKEELLAAYPQIKCGWDAWGAMRIVVVDNGLEFHGTVIRSGVGRFGTDVQFCPRKKPWFKGKIERFFGTVNTGLLCGLPGKTFCNILEKEDYNPAKNAVIRLSTLKEIVLTWIVDIYHQKNHRGIGQSPAAAWTQGIQTVDRWLPESSLSVESAFREGLKNSSAWLNSQCRCISGQRTDRWKSGNRWFFALCDRFSAFREPFPPV
jgi:putative transposase